MVAYWCSLPFQKFLAQIFGQDLLQFAQEVHSLLVLEVCGGVWENVALCKAVTDFAQRYVLVPPQLPMLMMPSAYFNHIIGFGQANFFPHLAIPFLTKLIIKNFIECFSILRILPDLLKEEEGLGAHTSILLLSHRFALEYIWVHHQLCPFSDAVALQCPKCYAIQTLTFKLLDSKSGSYQASCPCGWADKKPSCLGDTLLPKGPTGWATCLLYGTLAIVDGIWKLPCLMYNIVWAMYKFVLFASMLPVSGAYHLGYLVILIMSEIPLKKF